MLRFLIDQLARQSETLRGTRLGAPPHEAEHVKRTISSSTPDAATGGATPIGPLQPLAPVPLDGNSGNPQRSH
jgi:hypothetical protein